jgi:hypothetical protein
MAQDIEARCRTLFASLARQAYGETFHATSSSSPDVLHASSCAYHALALAQLDPARAVAELGALYRTCQRPDGAVVRARLLPDARNADPSDPTLAASSDGRSALLDPPVAAYVAARLDRAGVLKSQELLDCATRQLDAIWSERLPPDTALPVILHPLESGAPDSLLFDPLLDGAQGDERTEQFASLARSAVACGLAPDRAIRNGHAFVVEDPGFCGWLLVALEDVGAAWERRGNTQATLKLRVRSDMIREAIEERLWWDEDEIYTAFNRGRQEPLRGVSSMGFIPAASRSLLSEGSAKRAIDRHLRPAASGLWGVRGLALAPTSGTRDGREEIPAHCVTPLAHYWAHFALVRAGRVPDARIARQQLEGLVDEHGARERYDFVSGEGRGAGEGTGHTLVSLVLEMRAQES